MGRLALATGAALGLALASTPALADESGDFIVENNADFTIYAGCAMRYSVDADTEVDISGCTWGIHIRQDPDGQSTYHPHNCSDPTPVHRIEVESHTLGGTPALTLAESCEAASE